jgi:hypothetical protein
MKLDYFKDMNLKMSANYDILDHSISLQAGFVTHRRSAVEKSGLKAANKPTSYRSFAPFLEIQYRLFGKDGPVITTQYEQGIKGICKSDVRYERYEFDGQYVNKMPCMQTLQMRCGFGFYTDRSHGDYFLDYTNFHENYIPTGWNNNWSGEFELLDPNWYNASKYYMRANVAYESPLMILSFIPRIGNFIEKEKLYGSLLGVHNLWPYAEFGYGFVNRIFSAGIFCGVSRQHFEGFGLKIGFELFNNW